jgi:hypothetical protein
LEWSNYLKNLPVYFPKTSDPSKSVAEMHHVPDYKPLPIPKNLSQPQRDQMRKSLKNQGDSMEKTLVHLKDVQRKLVIEGLTLQSKLEETGKNKHSADLLK